MTQAPLELLGLRVLLRFLEALEGLGYSNEEPAVPPLFPLGRHHHPVERFGVVLRLHSTVGISSSQHPGARNSGSINRGFIPDKTRAFDLSTCPLDCGCATDARSNRILFSWQNRAKAPSAKFVPLSVIMLCGCPYLRMMSFKNDTDVRPSHFLIGFTSIHLVNLCTITNM